MENRDDKLEKTGKGWPSVKNDIYANDKEAEECWNKKEPLKRILSYLLKPIIIKKKTLIILRRGMMSFG